MPALTYHSMHSALVSKKIWITDICPLTNLTKSTRGFYSQCALVHKVFMFVTGWFGGKRWGTITTAIWAWKKNLIISFIHIHGQATHIVCNQCTMNECVFLVRLNYRRTCNTLHMRKHGASYNSARWDWKCFCSFANSIFHQVLKPHRCLVVSAYFRTQTVCESCIFRRPYKPIRAQNMRIPFLTWMIWI